MFFSLLILFFKEIAFWTCFKPIKPKKCVEKNVLDTFLYYDADTNNWINSWFNATIIPLLKSRYISMSSQLKFVGVSGGGLAKRNVFP